MPPKLQLTAWIDQQLVLKRRIKILLPKFPLGFMDATTASQHIGLQAAAAAAMAGRAGRARKTAAIVEVNFMLGAVR